MGIFDKDWQKNAKLSLINVKGIVPNLYQFATNYAKYKVGEYTNSKSYQEQQREERALQNADKWIADIEADYDTANQLGITLDEATQLNNVRGRNIKGNLYNRGEITLKTNDVIDNTIDYIKNIGGTNSENGLYHLISKTPIGYTSAWFGLEAGLNLAKSNGLRRTLNLSQLGKYDEAIPSAVGDVLDASMMLPVIGKGVNKVVNYSKNSSSVLPSHWRTYYDKIAPKTNRTISVGNLSYKLLTPGSKLWRDRLFDTREYLQARKNGQYPLTIAERRQYITDINNDYTGVRDRLIRRRTNDYSIREHYPGSESAEEYQQGLEWGVPKRINFLSEEGNKYSSQNSVYGFSDGNTVNVVSRRRNSLLPSQSKENFKGIEAHETDHVILRSLDEDLYDLANYSRDMQPILNLGNKHYKQFSFLDLNRGLWSGSPHELLSEVLRNLEELGTTKSYRQLPSSLKFRINLDISDMFGIEQPQITLLNLSNLGYFKKGGGIHIKEKNKGKFTSYCGGKVTQECILRGKNSSNPAIRKRATFADNARHFKHKSGGLIVQEFKLRKMLNNIIINN